MARKLITDILLDQGVLTPEQLESCCPQETVCDRSSIVCLLEKQLVTPEQVAHAYGTYASLPVITTVTDSMADLDLLAQVPLKFLRANTVVPLRVDGAVTIVTADPTQFQPLDNINMLLGGGAQYAVATPAVIIDTINRYYPIEGAREAIEELEEDRGIDAITLADVEEKDILSMASEAPIIKLVNHILYQAVKRDASDIHIEPFEKELRIRYRIDGVMQIVMTPPKRVQSALISRIKIMAHLDIAEKRLPQDGRIQIKLADRSYDIRVSVLPVAHGERVTMRILDRSRTFARLEDLGMRERDYSIVRDAIARPNGIIYVTGPTGSGKTSTLYSVLHELSDPETNIITVEDPVEYQMAGISQVQVRERIGLTFAAVLRSILRQDPDIVMIGETRDVETAQIAVQAALTGHLVLSTLHTNSAPATVTRLLDMGVEPFLIASSMALAVAQRLVRALCNACKEPYQPSMELLQRLGVTAERGSQTFYRPTGCESCSNTGYKGRLAIFEVMVVSEEIIELIMNRASTARIAAQAAKEGMSGLLEDGVARLQAGMTSVEEVLAVAAVEHREATDE